MIITTDKDRIEVSDAVLVDLIGRFVRDSVGVSEMVPKNFTENLAGRLGFPDRRRGITLLPGNEGVVVRLSLQFRYTLGIASFVAELVEGIDHLLSSQLGIKVEEVHVEVVSVS